jgi:glycosyltransferase involved in cell wall biosynthesis
MSHQTKFSVLIPCYNEEGAIRESVEQIQKAVSGDTPFDLIVIDDGSKDKSPEILKELLPEHDNLIVVTHKRNRGYGAALKSGLQRAKTDLIVITDADGTYPNERIPELVEMCKDKDMVVGARIGKDVTYSKIRAIPKVFLRAWVSWISGYPVPDINSGLRVFRRDLALKFAGILPDGFSFTTTITLAMLTNYHDVHYEPIGYKHRIGQSKIQPIRDTLRFSMLILRTGTYFAPLRVFFPFVLVLFLLATGSLAYDIFKLQDLTDKTVLLYLFSLNIGMFALLADMIDKRT